MIRIGDFSRLSQVSIKALRYYDEMGLLKPTYVDEDSGYRYYTVAQLPRLNRLLALKDLGFTLEQIAPLLDESISMSGLHRLFESKQAEL